MPVTVEVANRAEAEVEHEAVVEFAQRILQAEGIDEGEIGIAFVPSDEIRRLKREHLGIDEATDVLAFPLDGRETLPDGVPRQLGDVVICLEVTEGEWRGPLVHALPHLLGHDHGPEMESREALHRAKRA